MKCSEVCSSRALVGVAFFAERGTSFGFRKLFLCVFYGCDTLTAFSSI